MQIIQEPSNKQLKSTVSEPRSNILNSYLATIENSFQENSSQLKLINYGTGSGKTHQLFQAVCETIKNRPDTQIMGIYIAPLREHLQMPKAVKQQYPDIPVYTINSLEMKTTDGYIKLYKQWIPSILQNKDFWAISPKEYPAEKVVEAKKNLADAKNAISQIELFKRVNIGDDDLNKSLIDKAVWKLNSSLEDFLQFLIRCKEDENDWLDVCLRLVEIFFPLHLLRQKSGIVMLTYDKFETSIPYFKHNGGTWIKKSSYLDRYVIEHSAKTKKFIFAFDEQEDGYQIMLNNKIDIISPEMLAINNALSSVYREFSVLFSSYGKENRNFLKFIEKNRRAIYEFDEYFEKNKGIPQKLQAFAQIYRRLTVEEGNSPNFLEKLIGINSKLENSLMEIAGVFDAYDESNPVSLDFEMLARVFSKFENNRSLLIPHKIYSKLSQDLMNIFSYNNLYIYNIEPLKKLFLRRSSGGHVHITEDEVSDNTSVADLIYTILAIRLVIKAIKDFLVNVLDAEDSQSRSLDIWSKQIERVQKGSKDVVSEKQPLRYLDRFYVYQSYKSIINIKEISRYQNSKNNLINTPFREISIGSTAILTSPEDRINAILANNTNVVFLISATGGIWGDLSTSYDMNYLVDNLRNESGKSSFKEMNKDEVLLCETIRQHRQTKRQITASFFNKELVSCPNIKTQAVVERFEKLLLKKFIDSYAGEGRWFGAYKIQELNNFIRFLFYLFEDDEIKEVIAFTQTLRWIKALVYYCVQLHHGNFIVQASEEHPNIFYVQVNHKKYQSNIKVKLILYEASFNRMYYDKSIQKTYLDELTEKEGEKIFFISAYQSAGKGLNPIITTQDKVEKDFDCLVLLMDSYYTVMGPNLKRSRDSGQSETLYQFALMKSIVSLSESNLEIKDFNKYLRQPEAIAFQKQQHKILLGKGILQAIGRSERRDFENQVVKIFINEETRKNLVHLYNYLKQKEPNEIRKLSVNNYVVYESIEQDEQKRAIVDYDSHVYDEIDAYLAWHEFREKMLDKIETFHKDKDAFAIMNVWDALRNPIVFKNPTKYLDNLKKIEIIPDEFIESLFYKNERQIEFTPYLAAEEEEGKKFNIISDSINGEKIYLYQKRLYPEYLKINAKGYDLEGNEIGWINTSTDFIYTLYNELIPKPEIFDTYIPRPHFFYDVLYPSFTENFVERWIKDVIFSGKNKQTIKSFYGFKALQDFKKYNKLYERFDLYYIKGNELFCIDVKAWSELSGNRLSKKTLEKTQNKLNKITSDYPEFSKVKGLLLNLHGRQEKNRQHSTSLFSGNLIYFDNNHFPVESTILRDFLFSKLK